jgi:hypothetical protein
MDVIDVLPALQSRVQVYAARREGEGERGASQNGEGTLWGEGLWVW